MRPLTDREGMAVLLTLTPEERVYNSRRAKEIFKAGGTLQEMLRTPIEEIAAARAKEVRQ